MPKGDAKHAPRRPRENVAAKLTVTIPEDVQPFLDRPLMRYCMSTDQQDKSISDQRSEVEAFARKKGYRIVDEYIDEGISGDDTNKRLGFLKMIGDADWRILREHPAIGRAGGTTPAGETKGTKTACFGCCADEKNSCGE